MLENNKNKNGFTLIETLIYIAIIGGVVVSFVTFALSINSSRSKTYVVQEVQANGRKALDLISQQVRTASDVSTPAEGVSGSTLVLDMGVNPDITFSLNSGVLQLTEGVGSSVNITSDEVNITSLTFINLAQSGEKDHIKIELISEFRDNGDVVNSYTQDLVTAVSLRQ